MKHSIIALALLSGLTAACNAEQKDTSAETEMVDVGGEAAFVNDEAKAPVFIDPKGDENVAVSGYDTVSHFEGDGVPVKGSKEFTVKYNGVDYHFASAENAERFQIDPAKFVPQYGGHCAWALGANSRLAPGDATVYKIVDGKLYLNFSKEVQVNWEKDIPGFIKGADEAWPKIDPKASFDNQ